MSVDHRLNSAFIIIAQPRSGSTALAEALHNHPDLTCHDELFSPKWVNGYRPKNTGNGLSAQTVADSDLLAERNADPERFLFERVLHGSGETMQVGFKVVYGDIFANTPTSKFLMGLVLRQRLRVIHLRRLNMLRCFISVERMRHLGIVHSSNSTARESALDLKQREFLRFSLLQEGNSDFVNRSMDVIANPRYEHLPQGYNGCLDALGVIRRPFTITATRMSSHSLAGSVANSDSWVDFDFPRPAGFVSYAD